MRPLIEQQAQTIFDSINDGALDRVHGVVTADFVDHGAPPGTPAGADVYVAVLTWVHHHLHIRYDVLDMFSAGDKVTVRALARGVHTFDHLGVPATGKPFAMNTVHIYRSDGQRLAEHWGIRDEWGALVQVGSLTPTYPDGLVLPVGG